MEERPLGRSGVEVTRIILGCGGFGGIGSSPALFGRGTPRDEAFRIMDTAWDHGITTFDTADAYGAGHSETLLGKALAVYGRAKLDRLVSLKRRYDPENLFRINHNIPPDA